MMPSPPVQMAPVLSSTKVAEKPTLGQDAAYVTSPVFSVRSEPTADDSFAASFDFNRFGIAIAAMIKMIATTISNSISEKPFCFFMRSILLEVFECQSTPYHTARHVPIRKPRLSRDHS